MHLATQKNETQETVDSDEDSFKIAKIPGYHHVEDGVDALGMENPSTQALVPQTSNV